MENHAARLDFKILSHITEYSHGKNENVSVNVRVNVFSPKE